MEKSLLKIVMCNVLTVLISVSVYSQDKNQKTEVTSEAGLLAINDLSSKKTKSTGLKEAKGERAKGILMRKKSVAKTATFNANADYITMVDGKTFVKKNGKFLPVNTERQVGSMKVHDSGSIEMCDGTVQRLQEGEAMTMDGYRVKVNETAVLKERMRSLYESCTALNKSAWEMQDVFHLINEKSKLMNKKMDLVNQKMMVMLDYMSQPHPAHTETEEYKESISLLDKAIENVEADMRDIEAVMPKEISGK